LQNGKGTQNTDTHKKMIYRCRDAARHVSTGPFYLLFCVHNLYLKKWETLLINANFALSKFKISNIMKKIFTTMVVMLAVASVAFAQPRAIGGRLGWNYEEFSYQHSLNDGMYLDLTAGFGDLWTSFASVNANVSLNWTFNIKGIWNWFVGPAAGVGFGYGAGYGHFSRRGSIYDGILYDDYYYDAPYMPYRLNIGGQIGFEWQFGIPLNLTVDWRPMVNVLGMVNPYYTTRSAVLGGLYNFGVGLRYRFH
jgi:hypothetical protein